MHIIKNISNIYIGKYKHKDYFVIEDENNTIVLNITDGKEKFNLNISLNKITKIYNYIYEYQEKVLLDKIERITLLNNVELINSFNKKNVSSPFLICIEDINNKKLYIDIMNNKTFTRLNYFTLKKYSDSTINNIYIVNESCKIKFIKYKISFYKKLYNVFEIEDEESPI